MTPNGQNHRRFVFLTIALCVGISFVVTNSSTGAPAVSNSDRVAALVEHSGMRRGLCVVVGGDADLALELTHGSEFLVHVRHADQGATAALRARADEAGFPIQRLTSDYGSLDNLPHTENTVDLVIIPEAADKLSALSAADIARALRPEGTAIVGSASKNLDAQKLKQWANAARVEGVETHDDDTGTWVQFRKPPMEGAGEWSHWEHGPDNNPVANDTVIKAPYMTQYLATPYYIPMPSVTTVAAGRTFLALGHITHHRREWDMIYKLIARNGYNGIVLWERDLPEGYLVHRSAFIATKDTFHMIDGSGALLLDSQTGAEKGRLQVPGIYGEWKWMAMKDGVLYVLAGKKGPGTKATLGDRSFGGWSWGDMSRGYYGKPRIPFGFGTMVAAFDLNTKKTLWTHKEKTTIDSRAMAIVDDKLFLFCPEHHVRALSTKTGQPIWTNKEEGVVTLIEEPGKGLKSTPGFRTACIAVATPEALILQGQTRMNVVALSANDGKLLWTKKKFTNNPNAIYVDGNVVLGVGERGSHVMIKPASGEVLTDLKFNKTACTRLTASSDSFFVRGEGLLRFDRYFKKVLVDGAQRPACNDGALPANGLLYLGPWQCDCNLSLIGNVAKCSAGDFVFDRMASDTDRLELGSGSTNVTPLAPGGWTTYRAGSNRNASTTAQIPTAVSKVWEHTPSVEYLPTVSVAAGGLVFLGGDDGKVRALDAKNGDMRWQFATLSPVKYPPTIANGRAYFGSGDGYVYALEAATGRLLWRFRAAPIDRQIMVYGNLSSTWPVHTGVVEKDGVIYFAAGIIDHDGTYVFALDGETGKIVWQNNSSGHLSEELRKGVSAQGNLTIDGNRLLLAGGNQVSPAAFDLKTGRCLSKAPDSGRPVANNGHFVGVLRENVAIGGGRILYSSPRNVATKGSFSAFSFKDEGENPDYSRVHRVNYGGIPPAWNDEVFAVVNYKHGKIMCCSTDKVADRLTRKIEKSTLSDALDEEGLLRWQTDLGDEKFEVLSLALSANAVVATVQYQRKYRAQGQHFVVGLDLNSGKTLFSQEIDSEPLPGGLLVDSDGNLVVTMISGQVALLGPKA
ncbi:MAG: PQQ-binding-like beta-propeller repeat protein [Planctomycetes bacterium]|nr:PQQ-binding-like beta-propeller repeat protein [Planctomycetota bacterium]